MKKLVTSLLALMMVLGMIASAGAATDPETLVVGTPAMNGDFIEGFGNSAYDAAIKRLLHYQMDTVAISPYDELLVNETVVKDYTVEADEAGNKTYTWTLYDDLKWSDGSTITAKDYVFGLLYVPHPAWVEAGASPGSAGYGLLGYADYNSGAAEAFAGVKLIDEFTFSMTIDAAELPYFYELNYASASPAPIAVYAPDCDIVTDESGSKLVGKDVDQSGIEAERAALIEEIEVAKAEAEEKNANLAEDEEAVTVSTIVKDANFQALLANLQNVAQTERFAPTVVCGPYKFVKFENQSCFLEINDQFKGTYEGKKPTIKYIEQRYVQSDLDVDILIAGDIDILPGVVEGAKIEAAKAADGISTHSFLRNGYGYYAMHCDWGVTKDENVRWAMAYLVDRNACVDYVLGGYGGIVNAMYGYAQWMYEEAGAELDELLVPYNLNIDKANEYLDLTEWKFESDGVTPFDASKANEEGTYLRHNENGEPLEIHHMGSVDNQVTNIVEIQFTANAPKAGIAFDVTRADFNALLENFYYSYELGEDRYYNSFNLATTFGRPFDPYWNWHSDYYGSWENSCQVNDPALDEYIMGMRSLEADQKDEFIDYWLKFQKRFQEIMAEIPLYSNEYYVCYSDVLSGVESITSFASWEYVVCDITKDAQ